MDNTEVRRTKSLKLLAVDPSLTSSGWALFSVPDAMPYVAGVINPPGPGIILAKRLSLLQEQVEKLFLKLALKSGDVLICEGPAPLVLNPNSALKVERVRGIFESVARSLGLAVPGRLNPRTVHTELLGLRGRQLSRALVKSSARVVAERLFADRFDLILGETDSKRRANGQAKDARRGNPPRVAQDVIDALLIGAVAVARVQLSLNTNLPMEEVFENRLRPVRRRFYCSATSSSSWTERDLRKALVQGKVVLG